MRSEEVDLWSYDWMYYDDLIQCILSLHVGAMVDDWMCLNFIFKFFFNREEKKSKHQNYYLYRRRLFFFIINEEIFMISWKNYFVTLKKKTF